MSDTPHGPHHVHRGEIVDFQTYDDDRAATRTEVMALKRPRRIHVGEHLTFLFENHDTIRYQIQEMVRVERIVREASIQQELDTYNELLGGPGQLGCALLIEIEDEAKRRPLLEAWMGLQERLYAVTADGDRGYAGFDPAQVGRGRLSSVQYLTFTLPSPPVSIGCDFPGLEAEVALDEEQRAALAADLASTHG
jgi:hypothetical protein|tara:strand:- start:8061 stop:8642 length:582 start_codon:yes stop_codon:yes gene_type:complete